MASGCDRVARVRQSASVAGGKSPTIEMTGGILSPRKCCTSPLAPPPTTKMALRAWFWQGCREQVRHKFRVLKQEKQSFHPNGTCACEYPSVHFGWRLAGWGWDRDS